jgi:hypothetical protein
MRWLPVTGNKAFLAEQQASSAAVQGLHQWQAPLQLVDMQSGTPQYVSTESRETLVIEDEHAQQFAQKNGLKYPIIPQAITVRANQKDAANIASRINAALTHNQRLVSILGVTFNE